MEKKRDLDALTGLKGIFIFVIVLFHTMPVTPLIDSIPMTSFIRNYGGRLGNYMFFMLSGFLICWSYRDRIQMGRVSFGVFMYHRLQKLYPLYLLTNGLVLLANIIQYGPSAVNLKKIALTVLLQNGGGLETAHPYNIPTWFVSALIVCYMAYYLVVYIARNKTQYFCLLAFGIVWGYSIAISGWKPPLCFGRNGESFMLFFIGCVIAEVYPLIRERQHRILQPTAFIGLAVSAVLLLRYGVEVISGDVGVAFAFFVCPLTLYLALGKNLFSWVLKCKLILWMGRISASVFFWHAVVYIYFCYIWGLCFGGVPIGDVQYAGYLVILVTLCFLSYRFLENRHHKQTVSSGCHHT